MLDSMWFLWPVSMLNWESPKESESGDNGGASD